MLHCILSITRTARQTKHLAIINLVSLFNAITVQMEEAEDYLSPAFQGCIRFNPNRYTRIIPRRSRLNNLTGNRGLQFSLGRN